MLTAQALELVQAHRSRIDTQIEAAVANLSLHPTIARLPLATGRWRMLQLLRHYHLFKRVEIFEPAMLSGGADMARQGTVMLRACQAGWEAFGAYTLEWSSRDIVGVWPDYVIAMRAMADRVHDHVATEQGLIADLLKGTRNTRPPLH